MIPNEKFKLFMFFMYTIIYEVLIWGLFLYLIVYHDWNEWTIVTAIIMSASQLKPRHFGLKYKIDWARIKDKKMTKGQLGSKEYNTEDTNASK